ncbi:MAG: hypothetical protein ABIZ09_02790 [Rhodoferax sp.]
MNQQLPSTPATVVSSEPAQHDDEARSVASLLAFSALAFAWSWTCWLLAPLFKADAPTAGTVMSLAGGFGPSLAAPVVVAYNSAIASSVLFAWFFNRSRGSIAPVLVLHTAVNAWSLIIPVMVLPDGSNLRPFQIVVGILVLTAVALLVHGERSNSKLLRPD